MFYISFYAWNITFIKMRKIMTKEASKKAKEKSLILEIISFTFDR
jgi:hypothetical protein